MSIIATIRIPATALAKPRFNNALEALRGVAALFVLFAHALVTSPTADPAYRLSGIWQYTTPSHLSVIIFFLLSGYVIGLSNPLPIKTNAERKLYLKKRFVRLYPIYLIAIGLTVVVATLYQNVLSLGFIKNIAGCLVFLQGLVVDVPKFNQPIWSLSYEIIYYLFFLFVSARQWKAEYVASFFLFLGLGSSALDGQVVVIASYAYGAVFWFLGMALVKFKSNEAPMSYGTMLAYILLMLCLERFNLLGTILQITNLNITEARAPSFFLRPIIFSDLSYLAVCVPMLLSFTGRTMRGQRWLEHASFITPALFLVAYAASGKMSQPKLFDSIVLPSVFYLIALCCYATRTLSNRWSEKIIKGLVPLGYVSYGIYIIHYPIFFLFQQVKAYAGTPITFIIRLLLHLIVVLILGWLLERKLQPWFRKKWMYTPN